MTVQRILNAQKGKEPGHISPDAEIAEVLDSLAFQDVGALIVSSDGIKVEGIISERDIVRSLQTVGPDLLKRRVRDLMTKDVVTCVPEDRAAGIMAVMVSRHLRHIPVVNENGRFISMVSIRDLLQLRLDEVHSEAEAMRSYIVGEHLTGQAETGFITAVRS
ncbi:MAG: CBS domain-containing protein [Woeseiaceae bacterium]